MSSSKAPVIDISSDSSSDDSDGWANYFPQGYLASSSSAKPKGKAVVKEEYSDPLPSTPSSFEDSDDDKRTKIDPPQHPLTAELQKQMGNAAAAFAKSVHLPHPKPSSVEQKTPVPKKKKQ